MPKGPLLNDNKRSFTTRDSLGIESVATSISAEICPVVNTVTPRAFYWPFMVWIYYDFYKYSGIEERTYTAFDKYLKRQDYFFVLSVLSTPGSDQVNLVGKQQSQLDLDKHPGPYPYNEKYFITRFGGMQYYNAGCLSMAFIIDYDPETDRPFKLPRLTKDGEAMALAFESVIKDTVYYKEYRRNGKAVPKEVLEEYGQVINIGLEGFDECKEMLRHSLFETKRNAKLAQSAALIKWFYDNAGVHNLSREICRQILFDHCIPSGEKVIIPDKLQTIANEWEIVIGRQYFTSGLEMIWKHMLGILCQPRSLEKWLKEAITTSDFSWDINQPISKVITECNYDFATREKMISDASRGKDGSLSVENGLKIIFSTYNRFQNKDEYGDAAAFLHYGLDTNSIALTELVESVAEYWNRPIKDFLVFVMKTYLIDQHYATAFEKMLQGRDGFYYEIVDGSYIKKHDFALDFQGVRLIQLMQVMKDLNML